MTEPEHDLVIWNSAPITRIPPELSDPAKIAAFAIALRPKERKQIVDALKDQSYEMVSSFVLRKALSRLKAILASLGMDFVAEMLQRPEIAESSDPDSALSDHEAIQLAEDLQVIPSATDIMRMRQSLETVNHFARLSSGEDDDAEMTRPEAELCLRTCIETVLGQGKVQIPSGFADFRRALVESVISSESVEVRNLRQAPPFYRSTTVNVLVALLKTTKGVQLENVSENINIVLPLVWDGLRAPERWHVGEAFAELQSAGTRPTAISGLRRALLQVHGFDFVPESLRSSAFRTAAARIMQAHNGINNYANEVSPMRHMEALGKAIPQPALGECVEAALCVYLGNTYGHSWDAAPIAETVLARLTAEQWKYFLNECLPISKELLRKLESGAKPRKRWRARPAEFEVSADLTDKRLLKRIVGKSDEDIADSAEKLLNALRARGKE